MPVTHDLAALFHRDLTRLLQQLTAFPEQLLWEVAPGIANSAGNLMLHLEGNLREYIGRQLGGLPYRRDRAREFAAKQVPVPELIAALEAVRQTIPDVIRQLTDTQLQADFPDGPFPSPLSTQQFLIHLNGHLNYHLGQIDYLRRLLTHSTAIEYATL